MPERWEQKTTKTPGPRRQITLDIGERSITSLLTGEKADRIWITENDDGSYGLHATTPVGVTRAAGVKPVSDVVVECMNELVDSINANLDEMPQPVLDTLDRVTERYLNYNGEVAEANASDDDPECR
jgi:hypothetical protein